MKLHDSLGQGRAGWLTAWVLLVVSAIAIVPLLPVDETRYAAVAWEMWLRDSYLVPYLNGETYSHKPPFLFWLFHAGWAVFGVNEWWLRLGPALFGVGALRLSQQLASRLWPGSPEIARLTPYLVLGTGLWALFVPAVMFDLVLAFWVLLALLGFLAASQEGGLRFWILSGFALGLGILTKGPVVLLHTLPLALLAPFWVRRPPTQWWRWYMGVAGSVLFGAAIALAWAIPAAIHGGEQYASAILWGQTAGRVSESFSHPRPWWWYLAMLPVLLLPWVLWPALWKAVVRQHAKPADPGIRFCLSWALPVFVVFCLVSGKRVHYLLPLFPAFGLLMARVLSAENRIDETAGVWSVTLLLTTVAALLFATPELSVGGFARGEAGGWSRWLAVPPLLLGLLFLRRFSALTWVPLLMAATVAVILYLQWAVLRPAKSLLDIAPVARELAKLQQSGHPVAHLGKYRGQYNFAGRLQDPITVVNAKSVGTWAERNPDGFIFRGYRDRTPIAATPVFSYPFRGRTVAIWAARDWVGKSVTDSK